MNAHEYDEKLMVAAWRVPETEATVPWSAADAGVRPAMREITFLVHRWRMNGRDLFTLEPVILAERRHFTAACRSYSAQPGFPRISAAVSWLAWVQRPIRVARAASL